MTFTGVGYSREDWGLSGVPAPYGPWPPPASLMPGSTILDSLAGHFQGWQFPSLGNFGWNCLPWCPAVGDPGVPVVCPALLLSALFMQGGKNRLDYWLGLVQASCRIPFRWSHCRLGLGARELYRGRLSPGLFCHVSLIPEQQNGGGSKPSWGSADGVQAHGLLCDSFLL